MIFISKVFPVLVLLIFTSQHAHAQVEANLKDELARLQRSLTESQQEILKLRNNLGVLVTEIKQMRSGNLRVEILNVGKINLDAGTIQSSNGAIFINRNSGGSIGITNDRVWLKAQSEHALHLQTDGNLVLVNSASRALWHSQTFGQ